MAEDAATTEETTAEETPKADPQFDKLMERLDGFETKLDERLSPIEQALQPVDPDEYLRQFDQSTEEQGLTDADYDQQGQLTPEAAQRELNRLVDERARAIADERVQAAVGPIQEQRVAERRVAEADAIQAKYPELEDEAVLKEMVELTVQAANELGKPELAMEPKFFEKVYLAERAGERAGQESPDGADRDVSLESARGASAAGGEEEEEDIGDRIVALAKQRNPFG